MAARDHEASQDGNQNYDRADDNEHIRKKVVREGVG